MRSSELEMPNSSSREPGCLASASSLPSSCAGVQHVV